MTVPDLIQQRLHDLSLEQLDIIDDSAKHHGHPGALIGGHYHLHIKAQALQGLSRLEAHRLVYQRLSDLMPSPIHALQITFLP